MRRSAIAAALAGLAFAAQASVIDIVWNAEQRFEQLIEIKPGATAELCGRLPAGARVRWSYESPVALDFNVHYHVGQDVQFPVKHDATAHSDGTLAVTLAQDYCWMWTNASGPAARLRVRLAR